MSWFKHGASRIHYEVSGSGEPVLLLPGFTDQIAGHNMLRDGGQQLAITYFSGRGAGPDQAFGA